MRNIFVNSFGFCFGEFLIGRGNKVFIPLANQRIPFKIYGRQLFLGVHTFEVLGYSWDL